MKYLFVTYVVFMFVGFHCDSFRSKKNVVGISNLVIKYKGEIDKPLPTIVFCSDCREVRQLDKLQFKMNHHFFKSIEPFIASVTLSDKKKPDAVFSIVVNNNKKVFLKTKDAKFIIKKLIDLSESKNELLYFELKRYGQILDFLTNHG